MGTEIDIISEVQKRIESDMNKLEENSLANPFYGKEIFFFDGCVEPILERNQLMGYLGAFSGNNKELTSVINYAVFPDNSWLNIESCELDGNIDLLSDFIGIKQTIESSKRDRIPNTRIIPERYFFQRVLSFIKTDEVKMNQFRKVNFQFLSFDEF